MKHFVNSRFVAKNKLPYRNKKAGGTDSKFFTTNRKGENHELREELRSPQRDRKRDAVKKVWYDDMLMSNVHTGSLLPHCFEQVIANMTIGKDVSTLFTDVINCIQTGKYLSPRFQRKSH